MSVRYIKTLSMPSMTKVTISLWFKHSGGSGAAEPWDWTEHPAPPDKSVGLEGIPPGGGFVFYDPYGDYPFTILPIRGPPPMIWPFPPINGGSGAMPHDKGAFMVTFGNPKQMYKHRKWETKKISTIPGVLEIHAPFIYADWPPPYRPHWKKYPAGPNFGQPLGDDGKLDAYNIKLSDDSEDVEGIIPPSYLGVCNGRIRVMLQTSTRATYKGYFYVQDKADAMYAQSTYFYAPITSPPTPGIWGYQGPYWAGYQFTYKDRSRDIMTRWPEFFILDGPHVQDGWNHLLISWDISGAVSVSAEGTYNKETDAYTGTKMTPKCSTGCKAWMALNGKRAEEVQGAYVSYPMAVPGIPTSAYGLPGSSWSRGELLLKPEEILPYNAYLKGCPRDGLPRIYAAQISSLLGGNGYADKLDGGHYISFLGLGGGLGKVDPTTVKDPHTLPLPSYSAGGFSLPSSGHPLGIPATLELAEKHNVGHIMAELNIWGGKVTPITEENVDQLVSRFIDEDGAATKPPLYEKPMGKPHIQLHFTSHWQKGYNTGKIGVRKIGTQLVPIPGGQFEQSGWIEKYKPDPELGK